MSSHSYNSFTAYPPQICACKEHFTVITIALETCIRCVQPRNEFALLYSPACPESSHSRFWRMQTSWYLFHTPSKTGCLIAANLDLSFNDVFQLDEVFVEVPDSFGQFLNSHGVLIELPAEGFLIQRLRTASTRRS